MDITWGNRANARDATDCGGRIGPYLGKKGDPDFRNKAFHFTPCKEGDFIIIVSDGVYDNFDPEHLGYAPGQLEAKGFTSDDKEFLKLLSSFNDWSELPNELCMKAKEDYLCQTLENMIRKQGDNLTPTIITQMCLKQAWNTTEPSRKFMEVDGNRVEPTNYAEYPGKMDHTTCICYQIQNLESVATHSDTTTESAEDKPQGTEPQPERIQKPSTTRPASTADRGEKPQPSIAKKPKKKFGGFRK